MAIIRIIKKLLISMLVLAFLYATHLVAYREGVKDGLKAGAGADDFVRQYLKKKGK